MPVAEKSHPKRNWLKHISSMFLFAEEKRIRLDNPCRGFKRPKAPKSDGFHTWTDREIAQYRSFYPNGTVPRLVMELALETSARRGDTTRLGPEQMRNIRFEFMHNKNGIDVSFPMSDDLQRAIDAMPKTNTPPSSTPGRASRDPQSRSVVTSASGATRRASRSTVASTVCARVACASLGRTDSNLRYGDFETRMLSPVREEPRNPISIKY